MIFCFCKQKTAYEMRISDWSSDVCSSDLRVDQRLARLVHREPQKQRVAFLDQVGGAFEPLGAKGAAGEAPVALCLAGGSNGLLDRRGVGQIGRASGRERGGQDV